MNYVPRSVYYLMALHTFQMNAGVNYSDLKSTISIHLLAFSLFSGKRFRRTFRLCDTETGETLCDDPEPHEQEHECPHEVEMVQGIQGKPSRPLGRGVSHQLGRIAMAELMEQYRPQHGGQEKYLFQINIS